MPVRNIEDVQEEYPEFEPGWSVETKDLSNGEEIVTSIENPEYGMVERIVICNDDGEPIYDQYQIKETPGSIVVPHFEEDDLYVGLIEREREVVNYPEHIERNTYSKFELPRGFGEIGEKEEETAARELEEEMGVPVNGESLEYLGKANPNTAFYTTPGIPVYGVEVEPGVEASPEDGEENIEGADFLPYSEVRQKIAEDEINCGLTLSGLMFFEISENR